MFDWLRRLFFPDPSDIKVEVFETKGKWYWHLTAGNGEIVCDGGQGYSSKSNCRRAANRVKRMMSIAEIE